MNSLSKYLEAFFILLACLIGFTLVAGLIFFLLRTTSAILINIPGFDSFYAYVITIIPYLIFLGVYSFLKGKIRNSAKKAPAFLAAVLLILAGLFCLFSLVMANLKFFGLRSDFVDFMDDNTHYVMIILLLFVFFAAGILALGTPKEEDWLEKRNKKEEKQKHEA